MEQGMCLRNTEQIKKNLHVDGRGFACQSRVEFIYVNLSSFLRVLTITLAFSHL